MVIMATELARWFEHWLLAQDLAWNRTPRCNHARSNSLDKAYAITLGILVNGSIKILAFLLRDWLGPLP